MIFSHYLDDATYVLRASWNKDVLAARFEKAMVKKHALSFLGITNPVYHNPFKLFFNVFLLCLSIMRTTLSGVFFLAFSLLRMCWLPIYRYEVLVRFNDDYDLRNILVKNDELINWLGDKNIFNYMIYRCSADTLDYAVKSKYSSAFRFIKKNDAVRFKLFYGNAVI